MKNYEPHVYSYIEKSTGIRVVKAVTIYDGKSISACAKCAPEDTFDLEFGTQLALKRLELKITQKRAANILAYAKLCKRDLDFIDTEKHRIKKSMERAEIAALDRKIEIKELEQEIAEMLNNI